MSRPPSDGSREGRVSATTPQLYERAIAVRRIELTLEREADQPAQRSVVCDADRIRIGSHPGNDLVVNDREVSRFHAILERGAGLRLVDTDSMNGTWISGVRVRDADLPLPECKLAIGSSVVRVRELDDVTQATLSPALALGSLYGASVPMRRLFDLIKRVASSTFDALIEGESGTGKELIATELVRLSARHDKPFVIVDCGSVSPQLMESELFGHARGAFTGAARDRVGAFEAADGGTVFLDEIGELPLDMQPKLLRALAAREVRRIGENTARKVDVRVIAATNRQLEREVNRGTFREDLFYRLSVLTVHAPPLRERFEDLELLVGYFLDQRNASAKRSTFTPQTLEEMRRYSWPGNVRELRNFVERKIVFEDHAVMPTTSTPRTSFPSITSAGATPASPAQITVDLPFKEAKEEVITTFERAYLTELMRWAGGNVSKAARHANLDRIHLHRLLQRHGLRVRAALHE